MAQPLRKMILIVEDEEKIATLIAAQLELVGYDVHTEGQGRPALEYAAEHRPDLVVLDLRLPDIDGYTVCKELRRLYHSWTVPVVMVTGLDQPIDQVRGFAHGADAYMTKPFDLGELVEVITTLLDHWGGPTIVSNLN